MWIYFQLVFLCIWILIWTNILHKSTFFKGKMFEKPKKNYMIYNLIFLDIWHKNVVKTLPKWMWTNFNLVFFTFKFSLNDYTLHFYRKNVWKTNKISKDHMIYNLNYLDIWRKKVAKYCQNGCELVTLAWFSLHLNSHWTITHFTFIGKMFEKLTKYQKTTWFTI